MVTSPAESSWRGAVVDAGVFAEENKVSEMAIGLELTGCIANEKLDATALVGDIIERQPDA
jgi:hypothetical protein